MNTNSKEILRFLNPKDILGQGIKLGEVETLALDQINQKVAGGQSLDEILDFVFDATDDFFPCDRLSIALLEENGRRLVVRWARAKYETISLGVDYSEALIGSTLQKILNTGSIRVINDMSAYLDQHPTSSATALLVEEGLRSSLSCPLYVEGRPIGFLFRNSKQAFAYEDIHLYMHLIISERLSQAVEKAWRIQQLTAANRAYMEMLAFASHELKSPISSFVMECEMLLEGHFGELQPSQRESLLRMLSKSHILMATTNDYLGLAKYESGQFKLSVSENIDLVSASIVPVLELLNAQSKAKQITVTIVPGPEPFNVSCDPQLLKTVFTNLIENAIKYGTEGTEVRVTLSRTASSFLVSVWNRGAGFPASERNKLFKRFSRLTIPEFQKIRGTGVGLYLVWQIIQLHGGRIKARSEYGSWAEFSFEIQQEY